MLPKTFEHAHINAARMMFNRCWFDEEKCQNGINALQNWHFEWDEKTRMLSKTAIHDWSSHGSKAFAYVAVAHEPESEWTPAKRYEQKQKRARSWMSA